MPLVRFKPTISVLGRAKTVRALDRAATWREMAIIPVNHTPKLHSAGTMIDPANIAWQLYSYTVDRGEVTPIVHRPCTLL
jgi:hypothetical protein